MLDNMAHAEERRDAHLLDYWRTIWRSRWTVLSIFIAVLTLVAIGTLTQKPIYRATAKVEISPSSRKVAPVADVAELGTGSSWWAEERYYNTQYEIIKSRSVAEIVFEKLDLYNHPTFKKSSDPVGSFAARIGVDAIKDTGIVEISLESTSPEEAAAWANATAEAFVARNLKMAKKATSDAVQALISEIGGLRSQFQDTQQKSFEYAEKAELYTPEAQQTITTERLTKLQGQLTEAQLKRDELETLLKRMDSGAGAIAANENIPQIANDPVVQGLYRERVALEREYERLLLTYKDRHIRVLEKQEEIDNLSKKIEAESQRIVAKVRTQLALQRDQVQKLQQAIETTRTDSLRDKERASTFDLVRGEATETKRLVDLISARIKEIGASSSLLINNLRILDSAPVPKWPVKPRRLLNLAIGTLLGLLLGVGTVFFMDYLDNTIRTSEDVEHYLKLNLLAIIPRLTDGSENAVKEAFQTLRTSLLFSRKQRQANVILVTSAGPQEGKTSTIISLARTLAQSGDRVLVVDCDLRRPAVHQRLEIGRDGGLTNYILSSEEDGWKDYTKDGGIPNLSVLTSGPLPPNPLDVFGHDRFKDLLQEARQHFDWVFIDSPPVVSLADAVVLSSMADMVALVIKHNENDRDLIRRCLSNLRKVNPNVIGAVLNNVDLERSHYKDYYYVGYYYYGESGGKKSKTTGPRGVLSAISEQDRTPRSGRSAG
jgi:capsular exopolysaccharide synthesis family protein